MSSLWPWLSHAAGKMDRLGKKKKLSFSDTVSRNLITNEFEIQRITRF